MDITIAVFNEILQYERHGRCPFVNEDLHRILLDPMAFAEDLQDFLHLIFAQFTDTAIPFSLISRFDVMCSCRAR